MNEPDPKMKNALSALVVLRLGEIGLHEREIQNIPEGVLEEMVNEQSCWVVRRGPDICPDCGRLKARIAVTRHTVKPLRKLFTGVE